MCVRELASVCSSGNWKQGIPHLTWLWCRMNVVFWGDALLSMRFLKTAFICSFCISAIKTNAERTLPDYHREMWTPLLFGNQARSEFSIWTSLPGLTLEDREALITRQNFLGSASP